MRKWILIFVVQLIFYYWAPAQNQVGCNQILEDAKEAYSAGMVDVVPALLNPCLESGLTGTAKQEAYILVITSYLFDYLPDQADIVMEKFLNDFPNYMSKSTDPQEFTMLLNTHKQQMEEARKEAARQAAIEEQARLVEQARQEELRRQAPKNQRDSQKKQTNSEGGTGIGFILGTNLSMPSVIEVYSVADPSTLNPEFGMSGPGLHFGAIGVIPLSGGVETSISVLYQRIQFSYSAAPYSFTNYEYKEKQGRFVLPVNFLFHLNPKGYNRVYLKAGIVADYLMSATGSAERYLTGTGDILPVATVDETDIKSTRSRMNVSAQAGAGIRFPVGPGFIFAEAAYQYGFLKVNVGTSRYNYPDFTWQVFHVDPDFLLHQISFSAGMAFYLK